MVRTFRGKTPVLGEGAFIAEGDPHAVIRSPVVSEIYMGMETDV
jgi:ABC-type branched-subunit amino acid transport system ATPase component